MARQVFVLLRALETGPKLVARGRIELPAFRFSGVGITVVARSHESFAVLTGSAMVCDRPRCTEVNETRNETTAATWGDAGSPSSRPALTWTRPGHGKAIDALLALKDAADAARAAGLGALAPATLGRQVKWYQDAAATGIALNAGRKGRLQENGTPWPSGCRFARPTTSATPMTCAFPSITTRPNASSG